MEQPICTREDLRIIVNVPSYYGVGDDGAINWSDSYGEGDSDPENFDAYKCDACDEWFCCETREVAWKAALDHLAA